MYIPKTLSHISLTLGREELVVILRLLNANGIAGIELSELQAGADGQLSEGASSSLDAALKGLVARGYVIPLRQESDEPLTFAPPIEAKQQKWTRVSVLPEVMALVGACAFAAKSLLLKWRKISGEDMLFVHEREGLIVVNTNPLPEIYTFTALENWAAAQSVIENILELKEQFAPSEDSARLDAKILEAIQVDLYKKEMSEVLSDFRLGLPPSTGRAFTETITGAEVFAGITMFQRDNGHAASNETSQMSIVLNESTCFVLEPCPGDRDALQVSRLSAHKVREKICALWAGSL